MSFKHPYRYNPAFSKRVAYFCMEYGVDQSLKTFSGGLGYLAGSHMRSAYDLRQNLIGIGILWKYGYYDQIRKGDQTMEVLFLERQYTFLKDTDIRFQIIVNQHSIQVKVWYLPPDVFGTAPIYFLSTDIPENDHLARTICHRLYDSDISAKIAQYILLGVGGGKLLDILQFEPDFIHLNEAHGLPVAFYLMNKLNEIDAVKNNLVFTTHTPVPAGNEEHDMDFLHKMGFFHDVSLDDIKKYTGITNGNFNLTLAALRLAKRANGVSMTHGTVANEMWAGHSEICEIGFVTNAQHLGYWSDEALIEANRKKDSVGLWERKKALKRVLFNQIADQTGNLFDENILTLVWARRFAPYKRADMLIWDLEAFTKLISNEKYPIQIIWAGKPYPMDYGAIGVFNKLVQICKEFENCTVLVGYELKLSKELKQGSDIWLNTPRVTREASGTSGMTAAMNGTINFSTEDGWIPEYGIHGENCFLIPKSANLDTIEGQDKDDRENLFRILNEEVLPLYYDDHAGWIKMVHNSMNSIVPYFDAHRMATDYYQFLYQ
jgi:starch phosphorylase